jgi:hypothetical protein
LLRTALRGRARAPLKYADNLDVVVVVVVKTSTLTATVVFAGGWRLW